jgi:hypothetical protein
VDCFGACAGPSSAFGQHSGMNCEPLDPRVKIAKETETRISASVKTVLKVAQAGGEVERKAKEEMQNLPTVATGRDQIEARWIYLFCEMLRTSGNLSEAQKKQYFDAVIRATKSTSQAPSVKTRQAKDLETRSKVPDISVIGALPLHLWEKTQGPDKIAFTNHRLGFIAKVQNNRNSPVRVNVAVVEGCVPVSLIVGDQMLIPGESPLPEPVIIDKGYGELQKTTIQRVRLSGTIRSDSREIPASGIGYVGILFPFMGGRTGALLIVPETVTKTGKCDAIKKSTPQPSVQQLFEMGPVHYTFPKDLAAQFHTGQLAVRLYVGSEVVEINPKGFGKLLSVHADKWPSLLLPEMYEVPDEHYPPIERYVNPKH